MIDKRFATKKTDELREKFISLWDMDDPSTALSNVSSSELRDAGLFDLARAVRIYKESFARLSEVVAVERDRLDALTNK